MRKYELELIAALAEGSLEDETEARALIESSSGHRAEYEAQKAAIEAMRTMPAVRMSDHERATLRRDLWTSLQASTAPPVRTPWYFRWSYVAAGVLVVAVGFGTMLSRSSEDATVGAFEAISEDLGAATETETASATTRAAADGGEEATDEGVAENEQASSLYVSPVFSVVAAQTRSGELAIEPLAEDSVAGALAETHADCLQTAVLAAGMDGFEVVAEIDAEQARRLGLDTSTPILIALPAGVEPDADTPVAFVDPETCELIHLED